MWFDISFALGRSCGTLADGWPLPLWNIQSQQLHQMFHYIVHITMDTQVWVLVLGGGGPHELLFNVFRLFLSRWRERDLRASWAVGWQWPAFLPCAWWWGAGLRWVWSAWMCPVSVPDLLVCEGKIESQHVETKLSKLCPASWRQLRHMTGAKGRIPSLLFTFSKTMTTTCYFDRSDKPQRVNMLLSIAIVAVVLVLSAVNLSPALLLLPAAALAHYDEWF